MCRCLCFVSDSRLHWVPYCCVCLQLVVYVVESAKTWSFAIGDQTPVIRQMTQGTVMVFFIENASFLNIIDQWTNQGRGIAAHGAGYTLANKFGS